MGKLKWLLYLLAVTFLSIPTAIVLMQDDITYSTTLISIFITAALVLAILGKMIDIYEKRIENKSVASDIGIIIGLLIVLVTRIV
ncbi:MAG: histidine kinase [Bacillaceae bacterium]|nr:histidine kinase [Bacillaceae bacterium]